MAHKKTGSSSAAYLIPFIFLLFLLLCSPQIAFARVSKLSKSKFKRTSTMHQQMKIIHGNKIGVDDNGTPKTGGHG
ncbi:hypothetical protein ABKV19_005782 [Rosa sericea]